MDTSSHPQGVLHAPLSSVRPLLAALAAAALTVSLGFGSSHREAPGILADPTADNTDVYAFTAKDAPNSLTVVANWLEEPAVAGKLDPKARYYVEIDNTGDGYDEDVAYRPRSTRSSATRTRSCTRRRR